MSKHRVVRDDILVGKALPWNVYDSNGVLLLRRGFMIESQRSLDRLLAEGLFLLQENQSKRSVTAEAKKSPSALACLLDARRLLTVPDNNLEAIPDFPVRVAKIIQLIDRACATSPYVAIASILLLQGSSYCIRHPERESGDRILSAIPIR